MLGLSSHAPLRYTLHHQVVVDGGAVEVVQGHVLWHREDVGGRPRETLYRSGTWHKGMGAESPM